MRICFDIIQKGIPKKFTEYSESSEDMDLKTIGHENMLRYYSERNTKLNLYLSFWHCPKKKQKSLVKTHMGARLIVYENMLRCYLEKNTYVLSLDIKLVFYRVLLYFCFFVVLFMILSLIAAVSRNNVIGIDGKLPWHYSEDLQRFRMRTVGHPVIMGRGTYESIGKPLPHRRNIVISKTTTFDEVETYHDPQDAMSVLHQDLGSEDEVFVIGGASLYAYFMDKADWMYITEIKKVYAGDIFFPPFHDFFEEVEREVYDDDLDFVVYRRKW